MRTTDTASNPGSSSPCSSRVMLVDEKTDFARRGFTDPIELLCGSELALLSKHVASKGWRELIPSKGSALGDSLIWDIATSPRLLELVRFVMGENVGLFGASIVRRAEGQAHPWHTDIETSQPDGGFGSLWIGIENTVEESSLKFVPRSHLYGRTLQEARALRHISREKVTDRDVISMAREFDAHALIAQPPCKDGEGVLFDGRIWHGSINESRAGTRTALLIQYVKSSRRVLSVDFSQLEWPFRFLDQQIPVIPVIGTLDGSCQKIASPPVEQIGKLDAFARQLSLPLVLDNSGWRPHLICRGRTENLDFLSVHASVLAQGKSPHKPHQHLEEELLIVLQGEAEIVLPSSGEDTHPRTERLTTGDFTFYPPYEWHTLRNVGVESLSYLMLKWTCRPQTSDCDVLKPIVARNLEASRPLSKSAFSTSLCFEGPTYFLQNVHAHRSILGQKGGYGSHADEHDVAIVVLEGLISINGHRLGPGGFMLIPAGIEHDMMNVSTEVASYIVFEFHRRRKATADHR